MRGPLSGLRVVELAGIGPAPFCGMLLSDLGAEVVRVRRPGSVADDADPLVRNRVSVEVDLKTEPGRATLLAVAATADVLLEGWRPGVAERLGIGPEACLRRNPRLVYGRLTGWGQDGPLAPTAGHDINFIAVTGILASLGVPGSLPLPPWNLVGDFGGGGMLAAFGVLAALWERDRSGEGQVVDAAMMEGASLLAAMSWGMAAAGEWDGKRGGHLLDGSAPFYTTYETSDGRYMAVGALEPHFFAELLQRLGIDDVDAADQYDREQWPTLRGRLADTFATRPQAEWVEAFSSGDACVTPVVPWAEAATHPQMQARTALVDVDGVLQPAPAPGFSRTPTATPRPGRSTGPEILAGWGVDPDLIAELTRRP